MRVFLEALEQFCRGVFLEAGLNSQDAATAAEVLTTADSWGVFTHGVKNLHGYIRRIEAGGIRKEGRPHIVAEGPAWARVDGDSALGSVASAMAMGAAIAKAKSSGVAFVGVQNSGHFGAAGVYAALALPENMIGVALANDTPTVAPPGGSAPVLGSNPIAFAIPAGAEKPILLDMATSTVAGGKVFAAAQMGRSVPQEWLVDAEGRPTSDPAQFPRAASLAPMAGHKGYGLALVIEILSAVLTGASVASHVLSWSFADPALATGHGAAFLAFDIAAFMPLEQFRERIDRLIREVRSAPRAAGAGPVLLPGEKEWAHREKALAEGIELPPDVVSSLLIFAQDSGWDLKKRLSAATNAH